MKYNININQKALAESNLDLIDCAILDWVVVICNSKSEAIKQKRVNGMTWVDYKTLLKDMPLIRIKSPSALTPRFKKIEQDGYIKCSVLGSSGHQKMYISLERKVDSLFIETNAKSTAFTKMNNSVHGNEHKEVSGVHYGEPIITLDIHNDTKDQNMSDKADKIIPTGFDQFWLAYPKKEAKKKSAEIWFRKKLDAKLSEILAFISAAKETDRWSKGYVKQPTAFLTGECWEDDLSAYGGAIQSRGSNFGPIAEEGKYDHVAKTIVYV